MDASSSVFFSHLTSAGIVVWAINKLKAASWFPLVQKDAAYLNRAFSFVVALLVTAGISYSWVTDANGAHTLTLNIPTLSVLAVGLWHALGQYVLQEGWFQVTKPK